MEVYLVGGAVRDELLGREVRERDWLVVGATVEEMLALGYSQVGKDFPVFLHPETRDEYALARTERKSGHGYTGFEVHASPEVTLEEDLLRRDLTVNAMARDSEGRIIDPYGGQADLEARLLRHVSPAFVEDPLRVLRVARFAARFHEMGFRVADETRELMKEIVAQGEMENLVPERVWAEVVKALVETRPPVFFEELRACGALAVLFPEIDKLFGVPQPEEHHPEIDSGVHTMMVLDQAARLTPDPVIRFAALGHDLGKGTTPEAEWPGHHGHERRSVRLLLGLCERYRIGSAYRDLALKVAEFHTHCHRALELRPGTLLEALEGLDVFRRPERIEQFVLACRADSQGRPGYEDLPYPQGDFFKRACEVCSRVEARSLVEQGLQGRDIANAIRRKRQQLLAVLKNEWLAEQEKQQAAQ